MFGPIKALINWWRCLLEGHRHWRCGRCQRDIDELEQAIKGGQIKDVHSLEAERGKRD